MFNNLKFYIFSSKTISSRHQIILQKLLTRHGAIVFNKENVYDNLLNPSADEYLSSNVNSSINTNSMIHKTKGKSKLNRKETKKQKIDSKEYLSFSTATLPSHPYLETQSFRSDMYFDLMDNVSEVNILNKLSKEIDYIIADENILPELKNEWKQKFRTKEWVSECVRKGSILLPSEINTHSKQKANSIQSINTFNSNFSTNNNIYQEPKRFYSISTQYSSQKSNEMKEPSPSLDDLSEDISLDEDNLKSAIKTSSLENKPQINTELNILQQSKPPDFDFKPIIIKQLDELRNYYHLLGDKWRAYSFQKAVAKVKNFPDPIFYDTPLKSLELGEKTQLKVDEIIRLGKIDRLSHFQNDNRISTISSFSKIWGVGGKTASLWFDKFNLKSIDELKMAVNEGKIKLNSQQKIGLQFYEDLQYRIPRSEVSKIESYIKKVALKLNPHLRIVTCGSYRRGLETSGDVDILISTTKEANNPFPIDILNNIVNICTKTGFITAYLGGSYNKDSIQNNIDISNFSFNEDSVDTNDNHTLVSHNSDLSKSNIQTNETKQIIINHKTEIQSKSLNNIENDSISQFSTQRICEDLDTSLEGLKTTHHSFMGICKLPISPYYRRIDIKVYHPQVFPFAILYFTGSDHFNRKMRLEAQQQGYILSDTSLKRYVGNFNNHVTESIPIPCNSEEDIFAAIGMEYKKPEERCL